jgi:cytochrome b subunit of formate dehydrogenase
MQDITQAAGLFWATVFGAALGVVAGTIIQYFITLSLEHKSKARQKNALMKEMIYNKSLACELSKEVQKLRNAVNGGVLNKYFGYFPYNKAIFAQAIASANNGMLYELLSIEHIKNAQHVVSVLSGNTETWVNSEITRRRIF